MSTIYIILLAFAGLGLIISRPFRVGVTTTIGAAIVFSLVIAIGLIFNIFYPIFMAFKEKDWKLFFKIWWRLINGTYTFLGDVLYLGFAERYDELGNVWGEWVEDISTHTEHTTFGDQRTTLSASIGFLEYNKLHMSKVIRGISWLLNKAFGQTRHAIGSWERKLALKRLEEENLHGNK